MAKYAIVRVEDTCPSGHDGCKVNLVCVQGRNNIKKKWCENCFYGDTKEQLISKVAQVIRTQIKKNYIDVNVGKIGYFIRAEELAKEIVEFLGVEE